MEELKDYTGPFKKDLKYEDFSKEVLVELLHAYGEEINLLSLFFAKAINKRFGEVGSMENAPILEKNRYLASCSSVIIRYAGRRKKHWFSK